VGLLVFLDEAVSQGDGVSGGFNVSGAIFV
jgi:hypothetical protein